MGTSGASAAAEDLESGAAAEPATNSSSGEEEEPHVVVVGTAEPKEEAGVQEDAAGAHSGSAVPAPELADCPREFTCPITHELMSDPVTLPTGHTYERSAIERWLRVCNRCPVTGRRLPQLQGALVPNYALRGAIQQWAFEHGIDLQQSPKALDLEASPATPPAACPPLVQQSPLPVERSTVSDEAAAALAAAQVTDAPRSAERSQRGGCGAAAVGCGVFCAVVGIILSVIVAMAQLSAVQKCHCGKGGAAASAGVFVATIVVVVLISVSGLSVLLNKRTPTRQRTCVLALASVLGWLAGLLFFVNLGFLILYAVGNAMRSTNSWPVND